jgi:glycosyltransferase involved in cell wall biosynthesis
VRTFTSGRHSAGADTPVTAESGPEPKPLDLLCLSHLRWDFVYQRPQHLLSRAARERRVFFWEEPVFVESAHVAPPLSIQMREGVAVIRPTLPQGLSPSEIESRLETLLQNFLAEQHIDRFIAWYYTPMAMGFTHSLHPAVTVYDCMDELSAFRGAAPEMKAREADLLRRADVVFTGGRSLYESKRHAHANVHCFPSSIDRAHFAAARNPGPDPEDQRSIPHPRAGFFGVLDERLDRALLAETAALRPEIHFVMLGPVAKISFDDLPKAPNLHYLGQKSYAELPSYIAHWNVAILPFALNESTAFISPTKTPEYLAAGRPVVSTPIRDVVRDYGDAGLVSIAANAQEFARALDHALVPSSDAWLATVDARLAAQSWDAAWLQMAQLVEQARSRGRASHSSTSPQPGRQEFPSPSRIQSPGVHQEMSGQINERREPTTCTTI